MTRRNCDHQWIAPYGLNDDAFANLGRLGESSVIQTATQAFRLFRQGNLEQADFDIGFFLSALRQQGGQPWGAMPSDCAMRSVPR